MAFKYINPGYAELLSVRGGTTVTGEQYSKTGISFWQPTSDKGLTISEFPAELYGKLDLYFKAPENADRAKLTLAIGSYIIVSAETSWSRWRMKGNNNNDTIATSDSIRVNAVNTLWFHQSGSLDGEQEHEHQAKTERLHCVAADGTYSPQTNHICHGDSRILSARAGARRYVAPSQHIHRHACRYPA